METLKTKSTDTNRVKSSQLPDFTSEAESGVQRDFFLSLHEFCLITL